jgi:hypothetical protein
VVSIRGAVKLRRDADAAAFLSHASFNDCFDMKLLADGANVRGCLFELKGRGSGDHPQTR